MGAAVSLPPSAHPVTEDSLHDLKFLDTLVLDGAGSSGCFYLNFRWVVWSTLSMSSRFV